MKKYVWIACIIAFSKVSWAQEKIAFLEVVCLEIDKNLGADKQRSLKEYVKANGVESKYDLPIDYWDFAEGIDMNEWEGPLHDSLRALAPGYFVSDYIPTEELVFQYYMGHLKGFVFDVRKAVQLQWEDEMKGVEARRIYSDSVFSTFKKGDIVYFVPSYIEPPRLYPAGMEQNKVIPFEVIACKVLEKVDSNKHLIVVFEDNVAGIRSYVNFIQKNEYLFFDDYFKNADGLLQIKKGQRVKLNYSNFVHKKPIANFMHVTFPSSCFGKGAEQLHFVMYTHDQIGIQLSGADDTVLAIKWEDYSFVLKGIQYKVIVDKKNAVKHLLNTHTQQLLIPEECREEALDPNGYLHKITEPRADISMPEPPMDTPPNRIKD